VSGSIARLFLRTGGTNPFICEIVGPRANVRFAADQDRIVWEGETNGIHHRATLWLAPDAPLWLWRGEAASRRQERLECDAIVTQDLGLGERGFLMNNEAYASQYIDHHIARDSAIGPVIMSRQNLAQRGAYPWVGQGCLEGTAAFATDAMQ